MACAGITFLHFNYLADRMNASWYDKKLSANKTVFPANIDSQKEKQSKATQKSLLLTYS